MSQLDDAIARYNRLLENGPCRDLGWVDDLHKRMEEEHLSASGRLICPFLRPNFITRRQYDTLVKTGESLICAIDRMQRMVLASPTLLARMELLPAEKMLAAIEGVIITTASLWVVDLFQRRFDRQGPLARQLARSAHCRCDTGNAR